MTLITMFDPSSHRTSVSARLGPRILCHQLATNRLSMSIVHYSILFPPRYIGATQDLLRTSLLFRIHYPYTVHTVQCTYCTYSLISNTFSIQNQHCESRKKLWQRDKWQLVGCTTNILLIFFVCLLYTVKKYSNGTGSWATWAATLLGTVQVLTGAPWAGKSSPAI